MAVTDPIADLLTQGVLDDAFPPLPLPDLLSQVIQTSWEEYVLFAPAYNPLG
jgi:hypothetical protein